MKLSGKDLELIEVVFRNYDVTGWSAEEELQFYRFYLRLLRTMSRRSYSVDQEIKFAKQGLAQAETRT